MHALLVTFGSVLSPRGGLAVRARATLDALTDIGIHVDVVSSEEPVTSLHAAGIDGDVNVHTLRRALRWGWSTELVARVAALGPDVDVVITESALLMPAICCAMTSTPVIWDTNECETLHYRRLSPTVQNRVRGMMWWALELFSSRRCRTLVAISEAEAQWWRALFPGASDKVVVVEHRPHVRTVDHVAARRQLLDMGYANERDVVLLFAGSLIGKHNATAVEWIVEQLAPGLPDGSCIILVGRGTERVSPRPPDRAKVYALGEVEDVDTLIAGADVCLAPLSSGAGVKTKVLHYLAHGRTVIGTPLAFEGITDAPGCIAAPLDELRERILREIRTAAATRYDATRMASQHAWLDATCGRPVVSAQWRSILARAAS